MVRWSESGSIRSEILVDVLNILKQNGSFYISMAIAKMDLLDLGGETYEPK